MGSAYKLQCPRPRNARACAHCRAKRTRCLRELAHSPCRRCQTLHLECQIDIRTAPAKATRPAAPKAEETDVVSGLFGASQKPPPSDNLVSFHHRMFQEKFPKYERVSADELPRISDGLSVRPRVLDQERAHELVEKFRTKSSYFPFVTVPEDIASPEHRFLYFAILTVSATDDMPLLRSLDARFRAVLAEKVVVAGEKSLDYLQGLLIYIAWYNMHLRPTTFQIYQYLHIAISMVAELRYNNGSSPSADQTPSAAIEIKNAFLGCYYLSSLLSTHTKRPNDAVLSEDLKSYLSELSRSDSPQAQMMSNCLNIQMNVGAEYRGEPPVHDFAQNDILNILPIKIAYSFLVFSRESTPHSPSPDATTHLQSIVAAANKFLDHLTTLPMNELNRFSIAEWDRSIVVICKVLESLSAATSQPELIPTARECARQVSICFECLANCLEQQSKSGRNPGEFPDMLYLFKSILDILLPLEAKIGLPAEDEQGLWEAPHVGPSFRQGQCPVLSGIRETDFWSAYQSSPTAVPSYDLGIDFGGLFGDASGVELSHEEWIDAATLDS